MTFLPAYLRGLGLSGTEISTVFAVTPLFALVVPLGWAYLADRTQRHDRVLRVVVGGAFAGFVPVLFARSLAAVFTVARVRAGAIYGRVRLWGSVGYVVAALALGEVLSARGRPTDRLVPIAMWLAIGCAFVASLRLRGAGEASTRPRA